MGIKDRLKKEKSNSPVEYDPDFEGPLHKRGCRDIIFLLLFAAYWAGMGFVAWYAVSFGDLELVQHGSDSSGNICGFDNSQRNAALPDLSSTPYVLYLDPIDVTSKRRCVASCPTDTAVATLATVICAPDVTTPSTLQELIAAQTNGDCAKYFVKSESILNRCVLADVDAIESLAAVSGQSQSDLVSQLSQVNVQDLAMKLFADLTTTWQTLAIGSAITVGAAIVWLIVLRFVAAPIVWILLLLAQVGLGGAAVWLYLEWQKRYTAYQGLDASVQVTPTGKTEMYIMWTYCALFVLAGAFTVIAFLLIIFLRQRIRIAVEIIREASKATAALPMLVFVPIIMLVLFAILIVFYLGTALLLSTAQYTSTAAANPAAAAIIPVTAPYLQWFLLLGFLWGYFFLGAVNQTTIAGAVATFYWTRDKSDLPRFTTLRSLYRCFRYHLGSLALGSLIIAIIYFIRIIVLYLQKITKSKNKLARYVFACLQCCLACLARLVAFLNKNAYIEIAIYGKSFCTSATQAFGLLVRNALRLIAIESVGGLVLFLSRLLVTAAGVIYVSVTLRDSDANLNFTSSPLVMMTIAGYMMSSIFLYVYEMAIDTIFLCFCEDVERNNGTRSRPYYMSDALQRITNVRNTKSHGNRVAPIDDDDGEESNNEENDDEDDAQEESI